ncbi:glycoside hydrolase superfamily [Gloeopeniophorella convolvens]|nr:glycoside hydrolase superfamily [Gloeopeniophorella convolvens]
MIRLAVVLTLASLAFAQQQQWGQCGGIGWTGPLTCVSGTVCTVLNAYFSQCLLPTSSSSTSSGTTTSSSISSTSSTISTTISSSSSTTISSSSTASSSTSSPACTIVGTPTISGGLPGATSCAKLNAVAQKAGKKYFGTATDNNELSDTAYVNILKDNAQFGQITPANSWKWDATEPSRGQFTFTQADQIATQAKQNGQLIRGHNCVWYNQLPSWVSNGGFNASTLSSVVSTHCSTLVGHFKGQTLKVTLSTLSMAFNDDGTWRSDVFYNTLGTSFVATALNAARSADPNTKLYINDYNIENTGAKATAVQNLIKSLKSAGTPIDGVGLQAHFISGQVPTTFQSTISAFAALGVEVAITELDIRMTLPPSAQKYAQQKTDYQKRSQHAMLLQDASGAACPWDASLLKKPAFDGIVHGFGAT